MEHTANTSADQPSAAPEPSFEMASEFLEIFDIGNASLTFQTIGEGERKGDVSLLRTMHGTLEQCWPELERLNRLGAGVFWTVNETDGRGRRSENIVGIRFVWHDDDSGQNVEHMWPLPPHAVVETSPGKRHTYWRVDGLTRDQHRAVMRTLVDRWRSDPAAVDLARVLRLPGTLHRKGAPTLVRVLQAVTHGWDPSPSVYPASMILDAFPPQPSEPTAPRAQDAQPSKLTDEARAHDLKRAEAALRQISPNCSRGDWIKAGMALHHHFGGNDPDALGLWDEWSAGGAEYPGSDEIERQWDSFARETGPRASLGSLFHIAKEHSPGKSWRTSQWWSDPAEGFTPVQAAADDRAEGGSLLEFASDVSLAEVIAHRSNYLVKGLLHPGNLGAIYGEPGAGKTFLALDLGWHVSQGKAWRGRRVKKAPVLYVALEGVAGFQARMKAAELVFGTPDFFARLAPHISLIRDANGERGVERIVSATEEMARTTGERVGLIVIDTLARAIAGDDENATDVMTAFVELRLGAIARQTGAAVLAVHHPNKEGKMRGNSSLLGALDVVIRADRERDEKGNPVGDLRTLTAQKVKDGEEGKLFDFTLRQVALGIDEDGERVTSCVVELPHEAIEPRLRECMDAALAFLEQRQAGGEKPPAAETSGSRNAAAYLCAAPVGATANLSRDEAKAAFEALARTGAIKRDNSDGTPRWVLAEPPQPAAANSAEHGP